MSDNKPKVTRNQIQKALHDEVEAAIEKCLANFGLEATDPDANRRILRALVAHGTRRLFALGCPAEIVAAQTLEAVRAELKEHVNNAKAKDGTFVQKPANA